MRWERKEVTTTMRSKSVSVLLALVSLAALYAKVKWGYGFSDGR